MEENRWNIHEPVIFNNFKKLLLSSKALPTSISMHSKNISSASSLKTLARTLFDFNKDWWARGVEERGYFRLSSDGPQHDGPFVDHTWCTSQTPCCSLGR